jgi:hypothetical protein
MAGSVLYYHQREQEEGSFDVYNGRIWLRETGDNIIYTASPKGNPDNNESKPGDMYITFYKHTDGSTRIKRTEGEDRDKAVINVKEGQKQILHREVQ